MVGIMATSLSSASGSEVPTFTWSLLELLLLECKGDVCYRRLASYCYFTFNFGRETW